ncbi:MAG: ribosome small subunit-dependent GTPase A [Erysipelotrichaceae bacterium]|nr:ribosome small subunit-dependent GTPase A [Erysipelotrichaceae bacterium]
MKARIIRIVSNQYTLLTEDDQRLNAVAMGKLRLNDKPLVGDFVEYEKYDDKYAIEKVLERKNQLYRPAISNIDQAIIVMSAVEPDFSNLLVDQLIFLISYNEITPVLVITKMDLVQPDNKVYQYIDDYLKSGYQVIEMGKDFCIDPIKEILKDKITVLTGQSGVGKSTLLNTLDETFALATQQISKALGRGKHTTRHTELYPVAGGWIADTPGFSSLDFSRIDLLTLAGRIPDFASQPQCRFKDCVHINEPDCKIKQGVNEGYISSYRYQNYLYVADMCNKWKEWQKK